MFLTIVSFVLLLGVLMFFHELGHYLAARRSGIQVEEFGVWGFPPRLIKLFTYDGTLFSINAIPLGAFVRMKGEDGADMSPGSFNAASAGARALTLVAGPAMNLLLAFIFSIAGMMSGVPAGVTRPQVDSVPPNSLAAQVGVLPGDILLSVDGEPIYVDGTGGDLLRLADSSTETTPAGEGVEVLRDGERVRLPSPGQASAKDLLAELEFTPVLTTQITLVVDGTPAAEAGLQPGDIVYAVNGERVTPERSLSELVGEHLDETVTLTLLRGDEWIQVDVFARKNPPPGQGSMGVGIDAVVRLIYLPLGEAIWQGVLNIVEYMRMVLSLPVMLLLGELAPSEAGFAGPVGIAQLVGGAVSATADTGVWFPIWQLAAIISAGLAIANMLPIPALDGGRLLFILFEKVRGRRIDPEKEGLIHLVGFALLLGLMVMITVSDIRSGPQSIDWGRILGR